MYLSMDITQQIIGFYKLIIFIVILASFAYISPTSDKITPPTVKYFRIYILLK